MFTYTGASRNKTLNSTSHDEDKEKLSSPPGSKECMCACAHVQDFIIAMTDSLISLSLICQHKFLGNVMQLESRQNRGIA